MRKFLVILLLLPGCVPGEMQTGPGQPGRLAGPGVWVASEMVTLAEDTPRFADDSVLASDGKTVSLFSAANETLSFQLIIDAAAGLRAVRISPGALYAGHPGQVETPTIAASNIRVFRMLPVRVTRFPAWYIRLASEEPKPTNLYDALVPANAPTGGQPYDIKPGQRLAIWVDMAVPRNAEPGLYRGEIAVTAGLEQKRKIRVELKVHDFVLPETQPIAAVGAFDYRTVFRTFITGKDRPYEPEYLDFDNPQAQQGLAIIRQMMRLAHKHRLGLFDRQVRPRIHRDLAGQLKLDWSDYDRIVGPYLSGEAFDDRVGTPAWPIPFSQAWPVPKYYGGLDSESYAATATKIVRLCAEHFRDKLKATEQIFAWPYRGEVSAGAFAKYDRLAKIVRRASPEIPLLCQLPTNPPAMTGWTPPGDFASLVDILAPPAQWLNPGQAQAMRTPLNPLAGVWLARSDPPYLPSLSAIATAADVRALPWFAMKYNCTGLFLPEVLNWSGEVFRDPAGAQARLFYPGKALGIAGVLPSVRLKRLRRGMQDIAYVWILRQRARGKIAQAILDAMVRYAGQAGAGDNYLDPRIAGWVQHGPTWIRARKLLTEEVLQAVHPRAKTARQQIADKVRWQQFSNRAHRLRIERVRAKMSYGQAPSQAQPGQPWRATILVDMYNEYDRPLGCTVKISALPRGWKGLVGQHRVINFPPGAQRVAKLVVEGPALPITPDGKIPVELKLTTDAPSEVAIKTAVPFIHTSVFAKPPTIDGLLNDWPTRPANTAGNFRLLGRRGETIAPSKSKLDDSPGQARRGTLAFAMVDDENLYLAIRCQEPNLPGMKFTNSNTVRYQQLLACGEDLVEILLDPGCQAKGPQDLYHIVVKPNGVMIEEKGIASDPPLGQARPLAMGATVAVGRAKGAWIVELKIPRSAFGQAGQAEFWGVNFTRFATQGSEASSWSGASRYFYDPKTMGTMFVTKPVD